MGRDHDGGAEPIGDEDDVLVIRMSRGKAADGLVLSGAAIGMFVLLSMDPANSRQTYLGLPLRAVLGTCAVLGLGAFVGIAIRLVRRAPALIVDRVGFHHGRRSIRWSDTESLRIEAVLYASARIGRLVVTPVAGRPIFVAESQIESSAEDVLGQIKDWADRHLPPELARLADGSSCRSVPESSIFADVRFDEALPGYDRAAVDGFLAQLGAKVEELRGLCVTAEQQTAGTEAELTRLAAELHVELPDDAPPTTSTDGPNHLGSVVFPRVGCGYAPNEVDRFLQGAGVEIGHLQTRYQVARGRGTTAELRLAAVRRVERLAAPDPDEVAAPPRD